MSLRNKLNGTGVALVTPFKSNFDIDFEALSRMINFVIEDGVEYLVVLGTTGEVPTISRSEKIAIIEFAYEKVNGRVPVVVGIGGNNTHELVSDLETFPLGSAIAVLSTSPYYNRPSQEGIYFHYKALAEASPKPILIYNVPSRSARNISASTTLKLAKEVANIAGIKEASGDLVQCMHILRDKPDDFLVISGDDNLAMAQIACGMIGVISVAANTFPKNFSEMIRLSLEGNFKAAKKINDSLLEGYELLFAENSPAGVKAFLAEMGLVENYLRLPLIPVSEQLQQKIKNYINR